MTSQFLVITLKRKDYLSSLFKGIKEGKRNFCYYKIELFVIIVNEFQPFANTKKRFVIDVTKGFLHRALCSKKYKVSGSIKFVECKKEKTVCDNS